MHRNLVRNARPIFVFIVLVSILGKASFAHAWGNEGHKIINRLAAISLPADVPAFFHTRATSEEMEYLGPEPDRWRSAAEAELSAVQAPEHFINLEPADALGPLPRRRLDFEAAVFASGQRPEKIGLQPWEATEVWERLKVAFREYRHLKAAHQDTRAVEQAAIFYAGWLGHYVADASQPLHTTVQYSGWIGPNPNGYTTDHNIHWQFEGPFVGANLRITDVQTRMSPVRSIEGDIFTDYVGYLRESSKYIEKVYQLQKAGGFDGRGTQESRDFTAERLAAGASKLRDMIASAWIQSGFPVPDSHSAAN